MILEENKPMSKMLLCLSLLVNICLADSEISRKYAEQVKQLDPDIKLTQEQLVRAFDFIENLKRSNNKKKVFTPKETQLPCFIERSSTLRGFLIKDFKENKIGGGKHKSVRKVVFYKTEPRVLADCDTDTSAQGEIKILQKLKGKPGIVPFFGSERKKRGRYSIYLDYYSGGSLRKRFNHGYSFNNVQILKIAKDLVAGLRAMHKQHLVHRDLHEGNFLIREGFNDAVEAVLVDFGKTLAPSQAKRLYPQVPKSKNPPEILVQPLTKIDRYASEIYALGCIFYHLVWNDTHPWSYTYNIRDTLPMSFEGRQRLYKKVIGLYQTTKKKRIGPILHSKQPLNQFENFKVLVFQMLHYQPKNRPSLARLEHFLQKEAVYTDYD